MHVLSSSCLGEPTPIHDPVNRAKIRLVSAITYESSFQSNELLLVLDHLILPIGLAEALRS